MRFLTTVVLAFLFSVSIFSQAHKEDIQKEAQKYYDYMTAMNLDGVLDYMHPKMFDMAPRAQMKTAMEQMFNSPEMKIEFLSNDVSSISDEKKVEGIIYAVVFYNSKMKMTFLSEKDATEEEQKMYIGMMKSAMATQFGAENVTVDEETMSLIINNDSSMFAIKDPEFEGWKFLGNDKNMTVFVNSIVPEAVRTELLENE